MHLFVVLMVHVHLCVVVMVIIWNTIALFFPSYLRSVPQISSTFDLVSAIGRGTFGILYLGISKIDNLKYALKFLVPTSSVTSIMDEVKALQVLGRHSNIIELLAYTRYLDQIVLVFPYFPHDRFNDILSHLTVHSAKTYIYQLLTALSYVHSHGIVHRDINPSNFLYNRASNSGKLIDFGMAKLINKPRKYYVFSRPQTYCAKCSHNANSVCTKCLAKKEKRVPRSGTPGYRAPEILLQYQKQTSSIDIWSCGVILLSLLSKRYPFFTASDDKRALAEIVHVFGSSACIYAASQIGISLNISENFKEHSVAEICRQASLEEEYSDLIKLASTLLDVNCLTRISAEQALREFHFCE